MMRLIDADAIPFRDELKRLSVLDHDKYITAETLEYMLEHAPTVDAVPVIRCRDCFWYITNELKQDGTVDKRYKPSFCNLRRKYMPENGYCSEAERRTE